MVSESAGFVVLIWDGHDLYAVIGPFPTKAEANKYREDDDIGLRYQIVPLWKPTPLEEERK